MWAVDVERGKREGAKLAEDLAGGKSIDFEGENSSPVDGRITMHDEEAHRSATSS